MTKLVILHEHQSLLCVGPDQVLASLRQKYWVLGGKRVVRDTLRKLCFRCKRQYAKQGFQIMGQLPETRLTATRPFEATGFDAFGPLGVKEKDLNTNGLIFVCLFTRYVHVELTTNLSAQEILHCWDRFTARFSCPATVYSDNYKSFKKLAEILSDNQELFSTYFKQKSIKWNFIPPKTPHAGGHYERLVGVIKKPLKNALKTKLLSFRELETIMIKVLTIVNNRPITYTSEDPNDLEPLTPNHLMFGRLLIQPEWNIVNSTGLSKAYNIRERVINQFWKDFSNEYIRSLLPYPKWFEENPKANILNRMVLLESQYSNREHWPLAKITQLHPDKFGAIRVVSVKTTKGTFVRDIRKLYFLDIETEKTDSETSTKKEIKSPDSKRVEPVDGQEKVKRSRGRPKGSKTKKKPLKDDKRTENVQSEISQPRNENSTEINKKTKCGRVIQKPKRLGY